MNQFLLHHADLLLNLRRKVSQSFCFRVVGALFCLVLFMCCTGHGTGQGTEAEVAREAKFAEGANRQTATEPDTTPKAQTVSQSLPKPAVPVQKDSFTREELLGRFEQESHPDFVPIGKPYTDQNGMFLRRAAAEAFQEMWKAAKKDGVPLRIISSTRNYQRQSQIWNGKWAKLADSGLSDQEKARKILLFSSMPGSSRHHWGTDIDLNDLNDAYFQDNKPGGKVYAWLVKNAAHYGFCQPYTSKKDGRTGYEEEKWHWSYMPLSQPMLAAYVRQVSYADITGFEGAQVAKEIDIIKNYVQGIGCK